MDAHLPAQICSIDTQSQHFENSLVSFDRLHQPQYVFGT